MNIFILHSDPDNAARVHCDKHVPKLTLEAVQIANTGLHLAGADSHAFYNATHKKHPWCKFAAKSFDHFQFVRERAHALGREFQCRYDGYHSSHEKSAQNWTESDLTELSERLGRADSASVWSDIPQAMPDKYQQCDPVRAYRDYYRAEKVPQFSYERADSPMIRWVAPNRKT